MVDRSSSASSSSSISPITALHPAKPHAGAQRGRGEGRGGEGREGSEPADERAKRRLRVRAHDSRPHAAGAAHDMRCAHVVAAHEVEAEGHLLDRCVGGEDTLVALVEHDVGLLVVPLEHALRRRRWRRSAVRTSGDRGGRSGGRSRSDAAAGRAPTQRSTRRARSRGRPAQMCNGCSAGRACARMLGSAPAGASRHSSPRARALRIAQRARQRSTRARHERDGRRRTRAAMRSAARAKPLRGRARARPCARAALSRAYSPRSFANRRPSCSSRAPTNKCRWTCACLSSDARACAPRARQRARSCTEAGRRTRKKEISTLLGTVSYTHLTLPTTPYV